MGGWIVQTLLGAWSFLLPMARPGHLDVRRAGLIAMESAAWLELAALNIGIALMALRGAGRLGPTAGSIGVGLALTGGAIGLVKVWTFPALAATQLSGGRGDAIWGRPEPPGGDGRDG